MLTVRSARVHSNRDMSPNSGIRTGHQQDTVKIIEGIREPMVGAAGSILLPGKTSGHDSF